jgi:hypothetical protein
MWIMVKGFKISIGFHSFLRFIHGLVAVAFKIPEGLVEVEKKGVCMFLLETWRKFQTSEPKHLFICIK